MVSTERAPLQLRDRFIGGLVGLVIGDALGVPVEFSSRYERKHDPVRGMRGYGAHLQPRGAWSDDGALSLAHADAFRLHGWSPEAHLKAFSDWYLHGAYAAHGRVFDIGGATRRALDRFHDGVPADSVGSDGAFDNGNGSLMRILPAALWWLDRPVMERDRLLGEASALTHGHIRSRIACAWFGHLVSGLLRGQYITEILPAAAVHLERITPESEKETFALLSDTTILDRKPDAVPNDGHVISTLCCACWCLHRHETYANAVLAAVNLGGDTDTSAAVTGALAGLRCGFSGLPTPWVTGLPRTPWLLNLAEEFADAAMAKEHES